MSSRKSVLFSALALIVTLSSVSHGQIDFNVASGDWNDPASWTPALPGDPGQQVFIGRNTSPATVTVSGPLTNPSTGEVFIGGDGGDVTVDHTAGDLQMGNWSFIGHGGVAGPSLGTYNLSGGSLSNTSVLALGAAGDAGVQSVGTINMTDGVLNTNNGDGGFAIGWDLGNRGVLNQSGGTVNANWVTVATNAGSTGEFNFSGGMFNSAGLTVGENDTASGVVNVSGTADLNVSGILVGRNDGGIGEFNVMGSMSTIDVDGNLYVGLNDAGADTTATGTLTFTADSGGITPIVTSGAGVVSLGDDANLTVDMSLHPNGDCTAGPCTDILLVDNGAGTVMGEFAGLPEGAAVPNSGGRVISYVFGDGNDIGLVFVPEPSSLLMLASVLGFFAIRRR